MDATPTKPRRGIYLLPNLFTTGALFAGFYGIVAAISGQYVDAVISIFIAGVLDGLDGRVARLTNTQSEFGVQYDSLSDLVSFGVAPALVLFVWSPRDAAVQSVEQAGDENRDYRVRVISIDRGNDRVETGEHRAGREQIRQQIDDAARPGTRKMSGIGVHAPGSEIVLPVYPKPRFRMPILRKSACV